MIINPQPNNKNIKAEFKAMGVQDPIEKYKIGVENKYPITEIKLAIAINQPTNLIVSKRLDVTIKESMQTNPNKIKLIIVIADGIPEPEVLAEF